MVQLMPLNAEFDATNVWHEDELEYATADLYPHIDDNYEEAKSEYNPTPGTGRTGYVAVPPNNYPFYPEEAKYKPIIQPDGGQLSEWQPMYNPTPAQEIEDRKKAFETGKPHGFVPAGDKYKDERKIKLWVVSELHTADEYGEFISEEGTHSGGPFQIEVCPKARVWELRNIIRDVGGILPGLQRLCYAGKKFDDAQRTLQHYGVEYWHERFPHWPLIIRRY